MHPQMNWDAPGYFRRLTDTNLLARQKGFVYRDISGLQGLEDVIKATLEDTAFVAVANGDDSIADIENSPNTHTARTVFIAMRHTPDDPAAREQAMDTILELFRQFLTHLIRERTRLDTLGIYLKPKIDIHRIPRYFATGAACIWFQIETSTPIDLRYNVNDWQ